jgi:acetyltransferase-like isoleucine patch superfamily enzyme
MNKRGGDGARVVPATHGSQQTQPDFSFEVELAAHLKETCDRQEILELSARASEGPGKIDALLRRAVWRALSRRLGDGVQIGTSVSFRHLETFEIGDGVRISDQVCMHGRFDGRCIIGDNVWIGPQCFIDARDLVIGDHVGWGPGSRVLGSTHVGVPTNVPIISTDLEIKPVRIEPWADIGVNAVILPGVTVGRGSIVGAGAVVSRDVEPLSIVAGVPARHLRFRDDFDTEERDTE